MASEWWGDIKVDWVFLKFIAPHIRVEGQVGILAAALVAAAQTHADPEPQPWRQNMTEAIVSALVTYNAAAGIKEAGERNRVQSEALQTMHHVIDVVASNTAKNAKR